MAKGCIRSHGKRAERNGTRDRTRGTGDTARIAGNTTGCNTAGRSACDTGPGNASTGDACSRSTGSREPAVKAGSIADNEKPANPGGLFCMRDRCLVLAGL